MSLNNRRDFEQSVRFSRGSGTLVICRSSRWKQISAADKCCE